MSLRFALVVLARLSPLPNLLAWIREISIYVHLGSSARDSMIWPVVVLEVRA
jgi:hypothetical protein